MPTKLNPIAARLDRVLNQPPRGAPMVGKPKPSKDV